MVKAMNPELKAKIEQKMNEIIEIMEQYLNSIYGDVTIEEIELRKVDRTMNDGSIKHELTVDIDTPNGYLRLEDKNEEKKVEQNTNANNESEED